MKKYIIILVAALIGAGIVVPLFFTKDMLLGAGATFPHPLYARMFDTYSKQTGIEINYEAIGSGGGIAQLLKKSVDFGGTDIPVSLNGQYNGTLIVHIPVAVGGVAVTYNLPGSPRIRFSREVIADIFIGRINAWNDPAVARENPGIALPDLPIIVVYRSDGSGTTALFTEFLSQVSPAWKDSVGAGLSVKWPVGVGAKGNLGIVSLIKQVPGSIGYMELAYCLENGLPMAAIKNKSGIFVEPSIESTGICANIPIPENTEVLLTDTEQKEGYPISGFTWIIFFGKLGKDDMTFKQAKELVDLAWWMTHDGQQFCAKLNYAPLSADVVKKAERLIESVTYEGKPVR